MAFSGQEGSNTDVWVYDIDRGARTSLNSVGRLASFAPVAWAPTGEEVAFSLSPASNSDIFLRRTDGSGEETTIAATPLAEFLNDWSRDGKYLVYHLLDTATQTDLWYLERSNDGSGWKPHVFLKTSFRERAVKFSPDGRFVAYVSDESGGDKVYVLPLPEGRGKTTVSNNGGAKARWSRDGKELFYVEGSRVIPLQPNSRNASGARGGTRTSHVPGRHVSC